MIKLYDRETSGNCYKIRLLLSFLEIPYQKISIPLENGKNVVGENYDALNPRKQIPTLIDSEVTLWGSTAILTFLARKYDSPHQWLPIDAINLAKIQQWLEFAQNEINTGLALARAINYFGYDGNIYEATQKAYTALSILEKHLACQKWLVGISASIADIACFPYTAMASQANINLTDYPNIERWVDQFKSLDRFITMPGIVMTK